MHYEEYIIGTKPVPKWLRGRIMPYKKMNGEVGYEYKYRKGQVFVMVELNPGDSILHYGGKTYIQRKENEI